MPYSFFAIVQKLSPVAGETVTLFVNWAVKPFSMALLAWSYFGWRLNRIARALERTLETDDPIDPLAAEHPGLAAVEAEQRKKPDCLVEVLDDKADVDEVGDAGAMAVH